MFSSARNLATQFLSSLFVKPKKFEIEVVSHARDSKEIAGILKKEGDISDHLAVTHSTAVTLTWNVLKRCHAKIDAESHKVLETNNGFNRNEDAEAYKKRLIDNLMHLGVLVKSHNSHPSNVPVSVLCMQEITPGALTPAEMESLFNHHHFTMRCGDEKETKPEQYLTQECTEKKNELLAIAYDPSKVKFVELCALPAHLSKVQRDENRFQAVKFFDKKTKQEFVAVNVHQNWGAVNASHAGDASLSPATKDIAILLEHFYKMGVACIITGDFNTNNIKLSAEAGKIIIGKNANMFWDLAKGVYQSDSCDHIIMNEKYCREFLPALQHKPVSAISGSQMATPHIAKL